MLPVQNLNKLFFVKTVEKNREINLLEILIIRNIIKSLLFWCFEKLKAIFEMPQVSKI